MRSAAFPILFFCGLSGLLSQSTPALPADEPYEEIRLTLPERRIALVLQEYPDLEVMGRGDGDLRLLSRPSLTDRLIAHGYVVEILHPDLEDFYAGQSQVPTGNGPWFSYDETVAELNALHQQFPQVVTAPFSIGRTHEQREIWAIRISDFPESDEGEPEVLFDSAHHAREIMTVELILYFARYLCENYTVDPFVTYLVDHRAITFVPIVNPDGFVYNETTNPAGGGMWRKNRRNDLGDCIGVDINRNYPYEWGGTGSSGDPCNETYRGTEAASEPEAAAMVDLIRSRHFITHNSIHSVVGTVLLPWCYTSDPTADDSVLRTMAASMVAENGYSYGQCPEILYTVSGGLIDWTYGDQMTKPKIYSFSTEIGGSGFWPAFSERDVLIRENLGSMLYLTEVAGAALAVVDVAVFDEGGDEQIGPGESIDLVATIVNRGLVAEAGDVTLRLRCDDPYVRLIRAMTGGATIPAQGTYNNQSEPLRFEVEPSTPIGREVEFTLEIEGDRISRFEEPLSWTIGQLPLVASDDFEQTVGEWQIDESHTAETGAFERMEPLATEYQPGEDTSEDGTYALVTGQNESAAIGDVDEGIASTRTRDYDLSNYEDVRFSLDYFHGQRDGGDDPYGDWFRIDVSSDGGKAWIPLLEIGDQFSAPIWRRLSGSLGNFIELSESVRFRVQASDGLGEGDIIEAGIDEFYLFASGDENSAPAPPEIVYPEDGAIDVPGWATFRLSNSTDAEGDRLTYGFRIYSDAELTDLVDEGLGIDETPSTTSWTVTRRLDVGTYFWRAYAADSGARSLYSGRAAFTVTDSSHGLGDPPADGLSILAGPNPASETIRIRYRVPPSTATEIAIYDITGRRVRHFDEGTGGSGWKELVWDGRDNAGIRVAQGVYFARLWTPTETRTIQVVRIE